MLGLRPDSDQHHLNGFQSNSAYKRSSKFAERLSGRFFVSGISGSFQKHSKQLVELANKDKPIDKFIKYTYQPVLEKHQREELRKDAERLIELEEKLQELQRVKEAKRYRDRNRKKKKLEFTSAATIQKAFRKFRSQKQRNATDILISYLRTIQAKNAICTAVWAIYILRKFAKHVTAKWLRIRTHKNLVAKVATDNWQLVVDIACLMTAARREVADNLIHQVVTNATQHVGEILAATTRKKLPRNKTRKSTNDFLQFFLTEFDRDETQRDEESDEFSGSDGDDGDDDAMSKSKKELGMTRSRSLKKIAIENPNKPLLRQTSRYLASTRPEDTTKPKRGKQYNVEDHQVKRLMKKHQDTVVNMEVEQKRRLLLVEKTKQRIQEENILKKFYEDEEKQSKQKMKEDFQKKLETEAAQRKKLIQKLQEEKRKEQEKKTEELNREKQELRTMYREDIRLQTIVFRRPKSAIVVHKKKPEKKPDPMELEKQREKEMILKENREKARLRLLERKEEQEKQAMEEKIRQRLEKLELQQRRKEQLEQAQEQPWKRKKKKVMKRGVSRENKSEDGQQLDEEEDDFLDDLLSDGDSDNNPLSVDSLDRHSRHSIRIHGEEEEEEAEDDVGSLPVRKKKLNANDAEEEKEDVEDGGNTHVISSAHEQFDNLLDDFAFDDFIEKSLLQIYSAPPTHLSNFNANLTTGADSEAFPTDGQNTAATVSQQPVKTKKLKIPKFLKNTPYFAAYNRQMKLKQQQQQNNYKKPTVNEEPWVTSMQNPNLEVDKGKGKQTKSIIMHHETQGNDDEDEIDIPIEQNESLMSLVQRAKEKLLQSMQQQQQEQQQALQLKTMPLVEQQQNLSPMKTSPTTQIIPPQPQSLKIPANDPQSFHHILPSAPTFSTVLQQKAPPSLPQPPATLDGIHKRYGLPSDPTHYDNPFLLQKYSNNATTKSIKKKKQPPSSLPSLKKTSSTPAEAFAKDTAITAPITAATNVVASSRVEMTGKLKKGKAKSVDKLQKLSDLVKKTNNVPQNAFGVEGNELVLPMMPIITPREEDDEEGDGDHHSNSRPRSSGSKFSQKIHEYQDYEEKLQADYIALRQRFTQKLQEQLLHSTGGEEEKTSGTAAEQISADHSSTSAATVDKDSGVNDLRQSITTTYATEHLPKISTRDLLKEWAREDAFERDGTADDGEEDYDHYGVSSYQQEDDEDNGDEEEESDDQEESPQQQQQKHGVVKFTANNPMRDLDILYEDEHGEEETEAGEVAEGEDDERAYMENERSQYWQQLLSQKNDAALDAHCVSLMQTLGSKVKA